MIHHELLNLCAIIILLGVCLWFVNISLPLPQPIKRMLVVIVAVVCMMYILQFLGVINHALPAITLIR